MLADSYEPEPLPSLETIQARLAKLETPRFDALEEQRKRLLQTELAELRELLAAQAPQYGGIGHNRPPDEMALPNEHTNELAQALETEAAELQKDAPELAQIAEACLLYTSPSPRDQRGSRMPSSA